jgi:hypothetical protein
VSREIGAGLSRSATVIPVLVHGATMPAAEALPPALRALARRQAIVLTDQRWDRDVEELARLLSAGEQAPAAARSPRSGRPWVVPVVVLALAAVAVGAWMKWPSGSRPDAPVAAAPSANGQAPAARAEAKPAPAAPRSTAAPPQRFAVALPKVSEVRFRTHRAQLRVSILAIRQEPRDGGSQTLALLVRMTNSGPADEAFNSEQFRLIAGEQTIAPTATLIDLTDAVTAKETTLDFVLPAGVMEPVLEIRVNDEKTRIPIALSARTPMANDASLDDFGQPKRVRVVDAVKALPAKLAAGQRVEVGKLGYQIVEATIERETMEKASLALVVRCSVPHALGSGSYCSNMLRLWLDGVPRPPVDRVVDLVGAGESKEGRFVFDLLALPQSIEVGIVEPTDSVKVALSLEPVLKR